MLILSRVCAEFHDHSGRTILEITPHNRLSFLDAPEAIQEDPLFHLMLADGSLEAVRSVEQRRGLENDPVAGITAEGKKAVKAVPGPAPDSVSEATPAGKEISDPISRGNDQDRKGAKS